MLYPFILTTLAGLATLLGAIPIFVKFKNINNVIGAACSFASGVMICVSIVDLVPEGIKYLHTYFNSFFTIIIAFIFMIIGIIISMLLEKCIDKYNHGNNLYNVGILAMIIIVLHNIPEGIVTYTISSKSIMLGIPICLAIALHNIPEGISIAIPIFYATNSKFRAISYTFISAISELLGAIITCLFLKNYINNMTLGLIFNFTAGLMIGISYDRLLPTAKEYNYKLMYIFTFMGFIFMLISLLINRLIS